MHDSHRLPTPTVSLADLRMEDLLPHRENMLLVEEISEVDTNHAVTLSRVASTWPLTGIDGAEPLILVELAAQTAGVCNGWDRIQCQGPDSDQMGWLVAIKRAEFFIDRLPLGSRIRVTATNTLIFDKFREVTSHAHSNGEIIAEMTLQLYQA